MTTASETAALDEVLSRIALKDQRSRRNAILATILPAVFGLAIIAMTALEVRSLTAKADAQRSVADRARGAAADAAMALQVAEQATVRAQEQTVEASRRLVLAENERQQIEQHISELTTRVAAQEREVLRLEQDAAAFAGAMNRMLHLVDKIEQRLPEARDLEDELFPVKKSQEICSVVHGDRSVNGYIKTLYKAPSGLFFVEIDSSMDSDYGGARFLDQTWMSSTTATQWIKTNKCK